MRLTVTVVVVSYNHGPFIAECLDSVLGQTRPADKVLIVDDASTDASADVIRAWLDAHHGAAEFVQNPSNLGLNGTLQTAFARISTDLYTILAADDLMFPTRLEQQVNLMSRTTHALAYSDASVIGPDSAIITSHSSQEFPWPPEPGRTDLTLANLLNGNWIPAASLLLRTEIVRASGGYPPTLLFEDYELLIRLAREGHTFGYSEDCLVAVRRLPNSMMVTKLSRSNPQYLTTMDYVYRHFEGAGTEQESLARSKRWELAKAALHTTMPRTERTARLWAARRGAGSTVALVYHLARGVLARRPKPSSDDH